MTPEFSPAMLRLFIEGRVVFAMLSQGLTRAKAVRVVVRALARDSRKGRDVVEAARQGRLQDGTARAGLWGALGIVPADFGVFLLDDGGQE